MYPFLAQPVYKLSYIPYWLVVLMVTIFLSYISVKQLAERNLLLAVAVITETSFKRNNTC